MNVWDNVQDQDETIQAYNDFRDPYYEDIPAYYLYDQNGNLYADLNKGIAWIVTIRPSTSFGIKYTNHYSYSQLTFPNSCKLRQLLNSGSC